MNVNGHNQRASDSLRLIREQCSEGSITVDRCAIILGESAFALMILIFAILSIVAGIIPGLSALTGISMILIAGQMALGRTTLWLPAKIRDRKIAGSALCNAIDRTIPYVVMLERWLKPRLLWMTSPLMERVIGLVIVLLALILSMPIPGANFLPSAGIAILALGLIERDGLMLAAGLTLITATAGIMVEIIALFFKTLCGWLEV